MATEIERKFLVTGDQWRDGAVGSQFRQGYLVRDRERSVRVRIAGDEAWLNIKGATKGISRQEFEYRIPLDDALALLALSMDPPIEKTRYLINHEGHLWEVDEFHGANGGLLVAEIELENESNEFPLPPWVGDEVSDDPRYCNACLSRRPFRTW
jgi:CYTH domain-containing protein